MSVRTATAPTPAGSLPSAQAAAMITDHRACTSAQWNEAVLVRNITRALELDAIEPALAEMIRENVEPKSGAERDKLVLVCLGKVTKMVVNAELIADGFGPARG